MPSIPLHPPNSSDTPITSSPYPCLIQTPSGLALLEIQGTLHFSSSKAEINSSPSLDSASKNSTIHEAPIGRIIFPDYSSSSRGEESLSWMKRVYLYVGRHQRLTGEVKKLSKPVAVLRKREREEGGKSRGPSMMDDVGGPVEYGEELEVMEIVRYKILFAGRPEPVGE